MPHTYHIARIKPPLPPAPTADPDTMPPGTYASPRVASDLTGVSEWTVLAWARSGAVRSERRRGEWMVDVSDVERLVAAGGCQ